MDAPFRSRLRTLLALPLLVVAVVAGGSTGLAGLQLTAAPEPVLTVLRTPQQDLLGERVESRPGPATPTALGADTWTDVGPDARAAWAAAVAAANATMPGQAGLDAPSAEGRANGAKSGTSSSKGSGSPAVKPQAFGGTNHFWMPGLGIDRQVVSYPCPRTRPPGNYLYRWGCAGANNVYLLGHAYGVMKPLHDAYVNGRLRVGMAAWYANSSGKVRKYRITEWRVVTPDEAGWAIASQPVPSMTLQTCVGKNDAYRLLVRLVAVG